MMVGGERKGRLAWRKTRSNDGKRKRKGRRVDEEIAFDGVCLESSIYLQLPTRVVYTHTTRRSSYPAFAVGTHPTSLFRRYVLGLGPLTFLYIRRLVVGQSNLHLDHFLLLRFNAILWCELLVCEYIETSSAKRNNVLNIR